MPTPDDDATPADAAAPVPEVVEPIGVHQPAPEVGAVQAWDWRSGPAFGAAPGSEGTRTAWEPTPFASFGGAPSIEPVEPAQLVAPDDGVAPDLLATPDAPEPAPAAQPFVALAGAVAPDGLGRESPIAGAAAMGAAAGTAASATARAPFASASRTDATRAPGTVAVARILLWITAIGTFVGSGIELALTMPIVFGYGPDVPMGYVVSRFVTPVLLIAVAASALHLLGRRLGAARALAAAGAILSVVAFGAVPLLFVPTAIAAAVLLLVPASRPWFVPSR